MKNKNEKKREKIRKKQLFFLLDFMTQTACRNSMARAGHYGYIYMLKGPYLTIGCFMYAWKEPTLIFINGT
jgi:hypothetical protein